MSEITNQEKLDEIYHIALETHDMVRGMRRREYIGMVVKFFYWIVILGALGGVYYFVNPVIEAIKGNTDDATAKFNMIKGALPQGMNVEMFLQSLKQVEEATSTQQ